MSDDYAPEMQDPGDGDMFGAIADAAAAATRSAEQIEAQKEVAGTRRCTNWQDSCHGDPEIEECVCERRANL